MTLVSKTVAILCASLALAGCALERGEGMTCSALTPTSQALVSQSANDPTLPGLLPSMSLEIESVGPSMADALRQTIINDPANASTGRNLRDPIVIDVLSLSAGGQYGSFGAGFLRGWAKNTQTPRPKFDLVTGVSAGGMLAPVAFSGSRHDAVLDGFNGLDESDVYRKRPILALPRASSFFDPAPLEKRLNQILTDGMIEDIATHHRTGARLLVMAVDLDTTRARVFDLGEMAASGLPMAQRRSCMTEVMLASAAIPGVFPPRNIDGSLFVDGGVRDQIFLREVETARTLLARQTGRPVRVNATIVVNGSLRPPEGGVTDSLLGYAERSLFTLSDEILRDSLIEALSFAEANENWVVRGIIADLAVEEICPLGETVGAFDACVTRALFAEGVKQGRSSPVKFMTSAELRALANEF